MLLEELGNTTAPEGTPPLGVQVSEADAAAYVGRTIDAVQRTGSTGALLWCYADYDSTIYDDPPLDLATHERTFGLWRADGSPTPVVAEIASTCRRTVLPPPDREWIDITAEDFAADRGRQLLRLYARYCATRLEIPD